VDQHPAEHRAEDDRGDGEPFDPAVGDYQLAVRQVLGEDAVLRGRIERRAEPDDRVGEHRARAPQHDEAADDLDAVGDQHHLALRQPVGEGADVGREQHVGHDEEELEVRREPGRRVGLHQQRDRRDQQGIVGERREELRRHDDVEAGAHDPSNFLWAPRLIAQ
jgi:hypothetical protein